MPKSGRGYNHLAGRTIIAHAPIKLHFKIRGADHLFGRGKVITSLLKLSVSAIVMDNITEGSQMMTMLIRVLHFALCNLSRCF